LDREQALNAFATYFADDEWPEPVYLPQELLGQIAAEDLPVEVPVGIGICHEGYTEVAWNGRLIHDPNGFFSVIICHEVPYKYWGEAIGARFWLDLLQRCVLSRLYTVRDLKVDDFDDSDNVMGRLEYSFLVEGENLQEIFEEASRIQRDIEAPAESVLDDVTRALAISADRVLHGHYARAADLVARIDVAKSSDDKGVSLETLMVALFEQVPGFSVWKRNVRSKTEEIDLAILNGSQDPIFSKEGPIILVECKNWTAKVGRPEFSILEGKMRNRRGRCSVAFLISWSGFAETTWCESLRSSRESRTVVCLTGHDVRNAALGGNFPDLLRQATLEILNL